MSGFHAVLGPDRMVAFFITKECSKALIFEVATSYDVRTGIPLDSLGSRAECAISVSSRILSPCSLLSIRCIASLRRACDALQCLR